MKIPGNNLCCDCGNPEPRWASINLGITLCIACSGVHRSLGVHHSKVRSLTLDAWEPEIIKVMMELGNTAVNRVYEACVQEYEENDSNERIQRATDGCDITVREAWIKAKYVDKKFVLPIINARSIRRNVQSTDDGATANTSRELGAKRWSVRKQRRRPNSRNRSTLSTTNALPDGSDADASSSQSETSAGSLLIVGKELALEPLQTDDFELSSDQESTGGEDNVLGK